MLSKLFSKVNVFDRAIPMQLIMLNGIRFEEAYTIFSSAVFGFPYKIRVGMIGTQISKNYLKNFLPIRIKTHVLRMKIWNE